MPNWCDNNLKVSGPVHERQRLVRLWTEGGGVFQDLASAGGIYERGRCGTGLRGEADVSQRGLGESRCDGC